MTPGSGSGPGLFRFRPGVTVDPEGRANSQIVANVMAGRPRPTAGW